MEKAINELLASKYRTSDIEEKEESSLDINPIFMIHDEFQVWLLKSEYICNWLGAYINPLSASVCLVFEYMKYGNLEEIINLGVKPDESSIGAVAYVLLNALIEFHSHNCIHRDIRPTNILVGNNGKLKLSDSFVISKYDNVGGERSFNDIMYMSPERVKDESYTTSTDIWSLGILLIRYSTNCIPYSATSHWELAEKITKGEISMVGVENLSLDLRAFISQCIQQQPNQRASAQDLLQHPFIQTYISDQVIKGQDLTCISKYSKCYEDSYKIFDLEQSLQAIFSRSMEDKLFQLWIDPSASHFLKPKPNSDLEFLSQQLNIDVEYTKQKYSEMMISSNIVVKHLIEVMRLNKKMFKPSFIVPLVQTMRELVKKDITAIGKGLDIKETDTLPQILNVIVPENNDAEAKSENLDEILVSFRIPPADAKRYAESLINIGYDDMQSIKEDLDIQTLETIMKPGHVIRFLKNKDSIKPIQPKKTSLELAKFKNVEDVLGIPFQAMNLPPHQVCKLTEESVNLKIKLDDHSKYSTKTVYDIKEINRGDLYISLAFVRPSLDIVEVRRYSFHDPKQCIIFKELEVLSKLKENNQRLPWVAGTFNDIWSVNSPYFVSFHNAYLDNEGACLVYDYMAGILFS